MRAYLRHALALTLSLTAAACAAPADDATTSLDGLTLEQLPITITAAQTGVFRQRLDHDAEASQSNPTFAQRYWFTKEFADGPDSPVLYYFCGEQVCGEWALERMADTAKVLHAAVVAIEHRYYGESKPFAEPTLGQMRYLDIHQALEDAVSFQQFSQTTLELRGKYISVGGSYSGMLAAFYREKHPDLAVGAWASSAPVLVQKSFSAFDAYAARALGSGCTTLFRQAVRGAGEAFDNPKERPELYEALFGEVPTGWEPTKKQIMQWVSGWAIGSRSSSDVDALCAALEQHPERPYLGLLHLMAPPLVDEPSTENGPVLPPKPVKPAKPTGPVAEPDPDPLNRPFFFFPWLYQYCDEMGFYQLKNPDRTQSVMPDDSETEADWDARCQEMTQKTPNVPKMLATYVAPLARATNIFWTNGTRDPWGALSYQDPSAMPAGQSLFILQRGGHHDELANLTKESTVPVFESHVVFHALAKSWLEGH